MSKAVLKGKFIVIKPTLGNKKKKISINNLNIHLEKLKKEEKTKPKVRRKEIKKIKAEINEETKKTTAKINETKSWFLDKVNKIDKPLARLIKKKGLKSMKLEMKKKLQLTPQKYQGS